MQEAPWAIPGAEIMCVKTTWGMLESFGKCPSFMQKYTIKDVVYRDDEEDGHRTKIHLVELEGIVWPFSRNVLGWCSCGFQPLQKLPPEEVETTAPVTPELTDA